MFRWPLILHLIGTLFLCSHAKPQQQGAQSNADLDRTIQDIFSTPVQSSGTGFGRVVTPEPVDPSQPQIQFNSTSGRGPCNCVPYHMCDPSSGTAAAPVEDGEFDGFGLIDIRFNNDDPVCEHFLDVCCDSQNQRSDSLTPKPQEERPERPKGCGVRNVGGIDFNITGAFDNEAGFGEFPWTVALLHASNYSYFCGGSLIHPQVVLTAVHCVIGRAVKDFLIRAGEWDSQTTKERLPYQEQSVRRVITHPNYKPRNVGNNFALVILSQPFVLADHINVVCLPRQNAAPVPNTRCFANGWGKDVFGEEGRFSAIMKRVPLPIVEFSRCQMALKRPSSPKTSLPQPFVLADHINVVCLPRQNAAPVPNTRCFANGWGKDVFGEEGRFSAIMKRVPLPIVEFSRCQIRLRDTRLGQKFVLDRSFICAGGERGVDTCQGDGGAPLVCPIGLAADNRYEQDGIVSWGIGCNDDIPAAYANVAVARDWIDQNMFSLGYGTTSYTPS